MQIKKITKIKRLLGANNNSDDEDNDNEMWKGPKICIGDIVKSQLNDSKSKEAKGTVMYIGYPYPSNLIFLQLVISQVVLRQQL